MVLNATCIWLAFGHTLEKNKTCWTKHQYPDEWSTKIRNQTLENIIIVGKDQLKNKTKRAYKNITGSFDKPTIFIQCRSNLTQNLASKVKKQGGLKLAFQLEIVF